ncbi:MAG: hypothetical protein R3E42_14335 [Burkholderiaceae bacterium]
MRCVPLFLRRFLSLVLRGLVRSVLASLLLVGASVQAATLDRAQLTAYFPEPLLVGEKDPVLPVWPLFRQMRSDTGWGDPVPVGYAFESLDFAPVPGFSGTPVNLLIALDNKGAFLGVKVLSQHEPVFVEGLGPTP